MFIYIIYILYILDIYIYIHTHVEEHIYIDVPLEEDLSFCLRYAQAFLRVRHLRGKISPDFEELIESHLYLHFQNRPSTHLSSFKTKCNPSESSMNIHDPEAL